MADPRSRHSGRRSPTFHPARTSMPVNLGYSSSQYSGELHAVPTARYDYDTRRHDPKMGDPTPTTVTTYNVTTEPLPRSTSRSGRTRSSTVDAFSGKPIIVTTNHPRSHATSSHSSGTTKAVSPTRERYGNNNGGYYAQPASSIRSRSHHRHSHSYQQGAPLGDEINRLRERVGGSGDHRFWAPSRTTTDAFRNPRPQSLYATPAHPATPATPATPTYTPAYGSSAAVVDYDDDYYEYTKPSDLARYDLDHHDRDQRRSRRESFDRQGYYRPHVNVVSTEASRYEQPQPRNRAMPPSVGLDRYNRTTAAGAYDRPSVAMPPPPSAPLAPHLDTSRRPGHEGQRSPSIERRESRPRPISLYQDMPTRTSHPDDLYRTRDDERVYRDRRDFDDGYRDDNVTSRGFGIRTDMPPPSGRPASAMPVSEYEDRRPRPEIVDREQKRGRDESLNLTNVRSHDRYAKDDERSRVEESRDRADGLSRHDSISSRARDKVSAGLKGAAAAIGLAPAVALGVKATEDKTSPRRRDADEYKPDPRSNDKGLSTERDAVERRPSPREDPIIVEQRRDQRRDRSESFSATRDRDAERDRDRDHQRERDRERGREQDRDHRHEHEDDGERERYLKHEREQRERERRDAEAKLSGASVSNNRDPSPDDHANTSRRRMRPNSGFDPTDTKGLMDLKAELAALDNRDREAEKRNPSADPGTRDTPSDKAVVGSDGHDLPDSRDDESRGREMVPAREEKQVRVVSPPRDKNDPKPIKGILKQPKPRFPEDNNPVREGVAPHKDDKTKKDIPAGARWTKISRKRVNPEALTIGKERFEVRDDFVIVLRVLNKEEIQAYATATAQIREMKRKEQEKENSRPERHSDEEQTRSDEERQRRHRHRQEHDDEAYRRGRVADDRHR